MIAFVDTPPTIEPQGGLFLVTVPSGAAVISLMLTRHALLGLQRKVRSAVEAGFIAELEASEAVRPFSAPERGRR